jgi:hypothetical protein
MRDTCIRNFFEVLNRNTASLEGTFLLYNKKYSVISIVIYFINILLFILFVFVMFSVLACNRPLLLARTVINESILILFCSHIANVLLFDAP